MAAITTILVAGFVLLLIGMFILVYLNWSNNVWERVLSIALIGVATVLATVIVTLKETTVEVAFTAPVILDTVDGLPASVSERSDSRPFVSNLGDLAQLGRPTRIQDGRSVATIGNPKETERFTFCGELLQYQVLTMIRKLQRGGWKFGMVDGYAIAAVNMPMKLTEVQSYGGDAFFSGIRSNRFSNSDVQQFEWEKVTFPLPKNTKVSLVSMPPGTGPEQRIVRLEKPLFFHIDFTITPLGATANGIVPKGLDMAPWMLARCKTFQFQVKMHATFERITAGNWRTEEYKAWANWLFDRLKENLAE